MDGAIYKGEEVFTIGQVCEMLGKDKDTVKAYVKNHKSVFVEDVDYFRLSKADVLDLRERLAGTEVYRFYATNPNNVRAYTHAGVEKLANIYKVSSPFTGALEKAVEVYDMPTVDTRAVEDVIRFNNEMVDGRSLHDFLGVSTPYRMWFPRQVEAGQFEEGVDYRTKMFTHVDNSMNHDLTMDMAKEICMLQHNERGKQARRYFIECEKKYKQQVSLPSYQIEDRRARALAWVAEMEAKDKEVAQLKAVNAAQAQQMGELQPKADYLDKILKCKDLLNISAIAKDYGMSGQAMNKLLNEKKVQYWQGGMWLLYSQYQAKGYTKSVSEEYEANGETHTRLRTKWTQKGRIFLYNFLRKHSIVPMIEQENGS